MAQMSFSSPMEALAKISEALCPWSDDDSQTIIHIGSKGSGSSLRCCEKLRLIRIEDQGSIALTGATNLSKHGCVELETRVWIIYRECWSTEKGQGRPKRTEDITQAGLDVMETGWDALSRLSMVRDVASRAKFTALDFDEAEGGCIGWTLQLTANTKFCRD